MPISVDRTDPYVLDMRLRMPFDYGDVTVTERPLLFLELTADIDGQRHTGIASETMAPQWFIKGTDYETALDAMLDVVDAAREHARALQPAETVFEFWHRLYGEQRRWAESTDHPPLLWGFGVTLIERGLIDAWCRAHDTTFADAVRDGGLGVDLGRIYDDLDGATPGDLLPESPRRSINVRHTVGHTDPLTVEEIPDDERLDDGLPQSLREYVRMDGISYFKIKLAGDVAEDVERVEAVAGVITSELDDYAYTFDANEQYPDIGALREFWSHFASDPEHAAFAENLLTIEQPIPREDAMTDETAAALADWEDGPPIIIDESDDRLRSLERALACGYAGTSHKNCKGVFKGVANACLIEQRNRAGEESVITAEDLLNVGPVALLQDLTVAANLGIEHAERNGHHYFRGLEIVPGDVADAVGEAHGDLYRYHENGFWTLDVEGGTIDVGSLVDAPFGVGHDLDPSRFEALAEWRP